MPKDKKKSEQKAKERVYQFPEHGVSLEATSLSEAKTKLHQSLNPKKEDNE